MKNLLLEYLVASHCGGIPHDVLELILNEKGSLAELSSLPESELKEFGLPYSFINCLRKKESLIWAEKELLLTSGIGGKIICYEDNLYPKMLKETYDPPSLCLYILGDPTCLNKFCITIVGARKASEHGKQMSYNLGKDLAQCNVTVVSGLAYGIDISAHLGAVDSEGSTAAILGSGLGNIYPQQHLIYVDKICKKGCIVTEFPFNAQPDRANFPKRNRVMSGLSYGVVIVEASSKSGALITTRMALEQGRDVFAVPALYLSENNATNSLIRDGAIMVQSYQDIMSEYYSMEF